MNEITRLAAYVPASRVLAVVALASGMAAVWEVVIPSIKVLFQ